MTVSDPKNNLQVLQHDGTILNSRSSGRFIIYFLPLLYIMADIAGIYLSFIIAFQIRFYSQFIGQYPVYYPIPPLHEYLIALMFVSPIWIFIFAITGNYRKRMPSLFDRMYDLIRGMFLGALVILATSFFYRAGSFSRLVLGMACIMSVFIIGFLREAVYRLEKYYLRKGIISKRALFIGDSPRGLELFRKLANQPAWGITPVGFVADNEIPFPRLGEIAQLDEVIRANSIDLIVFNLPHDGQEFITDFVMKSENLNLEYMISPDIMGLMTFNSDAGQIDGIPILRWGRTPIEGYPRTIKRIFDFVFAAFGIVGISPLLIGLAIAVKLDSPGPILFKQKRVGRNGRDFMMLKFRSMRVDSGNPSGAGWTVKDDPRRTKVGVFIRKYNLDEFPQLFNVLLGDMSMVGPRPEQPGYVEKFKDDIPRYFQRHKVKSGVTGWAQVNGFRGDTSITERTKYDLYYVENWSLVFDIKIIFLTLKNMFKSPNAY
jgi:exopolysaccharide biosynthesis polyprenyl glycosylphosphotransferase